MERCCDQRIVVRQRPLLYTSVEMALVCYGWVWRLRIKQTNGIAQRPTSDYRISLDRNILEHTSTARPVCGLQL